MALVSALSAPAVAQHSAAASGYAISAGAATAMRHSNQKCAVELARRFLQQ